MTRLETIAVRTYDDNQREQRPLSIPILQAVTFEAESTRQLGRSFRNNSELVYQRFGHPASKAAGDKIARLEGAEAGLVFGSGMGAISTALMALIGGGETHVVAQRQIFAQTFSFLDDTLRRFGVETTFVDAGNEAEVRGASSAGTPT